MAIANRRAGGYAQTMKRIEMHRWEVASETPPGRRVKTRHHMTREEALMRDPSAVPIPGTLRVVDLPEASDEKTRAWISRHSQLAGRK